MRVLLIGNPLSRRGERALEAVRGELIARGVEPVSDNQAKEGIDGIVAAGGDGTLTRVIPRAIEMNVPMGVIPLGTFNELARTLQIPLDLEGACAVIAAGRTHAIDVARVNGVYYTSEASIGISSRIARLQTPAGKKRFGYLAIVATALQAFWNSRPMHVELSFDDRVERLNTVQLTVANSHRFGGLFNVSDAAIDDGWLDVYSVDIDGLREAFSVAHAILHGRRQEEPGLRSYRAKRFFVATRHRHRITADGEPAGTTPAEFTLLAKALSVFVPE
jgi:diacylglycerol kinase (ATP)